MKRVFFMRSQEARRRCAEYALVDAPEGQMVVFSDPSRTSEQNAKFHAICSDLAKSELTWGGKKRTLSAWKVLLVSGHAVATKEGAEVVPGLEGEFINLRESTALMSKARGSSLIEYALSFCAMNDVRVSDS